MIRSLFAISMILIISAAAWFAPKFRRVDLDWRLFPQPIRVVDIETVSEQSITQKIMAPGHLQAAHETRITPPFSSTVMDILVTEDQFVKTGQTLILLDQKPLKTALDGVIRQRDSIREMYDATRTQFGVVEKQLKQWEEAYPEGTQAPAELIQLRTQLEKLKKQAEGLNSDYQTAVESAKNYQISLDRCTIKAPHNGVVVQMNAIKGDQVGTAPSISQASINTMVGIPDFSKPATNSLLTIAQTDQLVAKALVDETDVSELRPGQKSMVSVHNINIPGIIEKVASTGRRQGESIVFDTVITLHVPDRDAKNLRAGMSAMVEMEVQTRQNTLSVPVQAVVQRRARDIASARFKAPEQLQSKTRMVSNSAPEAETDELSSTIKNNSDPMRFLRVVYLLRNENAVAVPVEIGISDEEHVEILSGLRKNDRIITGPFHELDRLLDDTRVEPRSRSSKSTAPENQVAESSSKAKSEARK